ncbi:hypothetical protein PIB30_065025, partial [Stylosanthes scabra]|nr:hypothetical protein [Stylosanthes scabra]
KSLIHKSSIRYVNKRNIASKRPFRSPTIIPKGLVARANAPMETMLEKLSSFIEALPERGRSNWQGRIERGRRWVIFTCNKLSPQFLRGIDQLPKKLTQENNISTSRTTNSQTTKFFWSDNRAPFNKIQTSSINKSFPEEVPQHSRDVFANSLREKGNLHIINGKRRSNRVDEAKTTSPIE